MRGRKPVLWLWLALFVALPLPFFWTEPGLAPALRIVFLAALMVLLAVTDGVGANMPAFLGILIPQALLWTALLYGLARGIVALLRRGLPERARPWAVAGLCAALLVASLFEIYRTPHSSSGPYANLVRILD